MIICYLFCILLTTITQNYAQSVSSCSKPTSETLAEWGTDDNFYHPDKRTPFNGPLQPGTYSLQCIVTPKRSTNVWISVTCDSSDGETKLVDRYVKCPCPFRTDIYQVTPRTGSSSQYTLNCIQSDTSIRYYDPNVSNDELLKIRSSVVECDSIRWELKDINVYSWHQACTKQCDRKSLNDDHTGIGKGMKDTLKVRSTNTEWSRDALEPKIYVMSCTGAPNTQYWVGCDMFGRLGVMHDCTCLNDQAALVVPVNGRIIVQKDVITLKCNDGFVREIRGKPGEPYPYRHDKIYAKCIESKWYTGTVGFESNAECETDVNNLECVARSQGDGQTIGATKVGKSMHITCATGYTVMTTNTGDLRSQRLLITCKFEKNDDGTVKIQYDNLSNNPPCMLSCTATVNHGTVTTETRSGSPRNRLNCDVGYAQDVDVTCDSTAKKWKDADGNVAECVLTACQTGATGNGRVSHAGGIFKKKCDRGYFLKVGSQNIINKQTVYCKAPMAAWYLKTTDTKAECLDERTLTCPQDQMDDGSKKAGLKIGGDATLNCAAPFKVEKKRNRDGHLIRCIAKRNDPVGQVAAVWDDKDPYCKATCPMKETNSEDIRISGNIFEKKCKDSYYMKVGGDNSVGYNKVNCDTRSNVWQLAASGLGGAVAECISYGTLSCPIDTLNDGLTKPEVFIGGSKTLTCASGYDVSTKTGGNTELKCISYVYRGNVYGSWATNNPDCKVKCTTSSSTFDVTDRKPHKYKCKSGYYLKIDGTFETGYRSVTCEAKSSNWEWKLGSTFIDGCKRISDLRCSSYHTGIEDVTTTAKINSKITMTCAKGYVVVKTGANPTSDRVKEATCIKQNTLNTFKILLDSECQRASCPTTHRITGGSVSPTGDTHIASCNRGFYINNGTHNKYGDIAVYCTSPSEWKLWHNEHDAKCEVTAELKCEAFHPNNGNSVPAIAIGGSHELTCGGAFDVKDGADKNKFKCVEKRENNIVTAVLEDNSPVCVSTLRCPYHHDITNGNVAGTIGSYTATCNDEYYIDHGSDKKKSISVSCSSSETWVVNGTSIAPVCLDTKDLKCSILTDNSNAYKDVTVSQGRTDVECETKFRKSVNRNLHKSKHLNVTCKAELNNNIYTTKVEPGNEICQKPCQLTDGNFDIDDDEALGKLTGTANCDADFYMKNGSTSGWVWKQQATCKWESDDWKLIDQIGDSIVCRGLSLEHCMFDHKNGTTSSIDFREKKMATCGDGFTFGEPNEYVKTKEVECQKETSGWNIAIVPSFKCEEFGCGTEDPLVNGKVRDNFIECFPGYYLARTGRSGIKYWRHEFSCSDNNFVVARITVTGCEAYTCVGPHTSHNQDHVTHDYGTYDLQCKMGYLIAISDTVSSDAYSHRVTCSETRSGNEVSPVLSPNNIKCKEVCTASSHLQVGNYPNGGGWAKCEPGNYLKESRNRLWNTNTEVAAKCSLLENKFTHGATNQTLECVVKLVLPGSDQRVLINNVSTIDIDGQICQFDKGGSVLVNIANGISQTPGCIDGHLITHDAIRPSYANSLQQIKCNHVITANIVTVAIEPVGAKCERVCALSNGDVNSAQATCNAMYAIFVNGKKRNGSIASSCSANLKEYVEKDVTPEVPIECKLLNCTHDDATGKLEPIEISVNNTGSLSCKAGYLIHRNQTVTTESRATVECVPNGDHDAKLEDDARCEEVCPLPANGSVNQDGNQFTAEIKYSCSADYAIKIGSDVSNNQEENVVCTPGGYQKDGKYVSCHKMCPIISNTGLTKSDRSPNKPEFELTCNAQHLLEIEPSKYATSANVKCTASNHEWNPPLQCKSFSEVICNDTINSNSKPILTTTPYDSTHKMKCKPGYVVKKNGTGQYATEVDAKCSLGTDGKPKWKSSDPVVVPNLVCQDKCPRNLPSDSHATIENVSPDRQHAQLECTPGHALGHRNRTNVTCADDRKWKIDKSPDRQLGCKVTCGKAKEITNGTKYAIIGATEPDDYVTDGQQLTFSCKSGQRQVGSRVIECRNGQWNRLNDTLDCSNITTMMNSTSSTDRYTTTRIRNTTSKKKEKHWRKRFNEPHVFFGFLGFFVAAGCIGSMVAFKIEVAMNNRRYAAFLKKAEANLMARAAVYAAAAAGGGKIKVA